MKTLTPTIVCPVDFSAPSRTALRYASTIANHFGARLIVFSVNDPLLAEAAATAGLSAAFAAETEHELRHFSEEELALTAAGPQTLEFRVAVGKPATEILRQTREEGADLIVIGSRGRSGIGKVFFGSTTERVLRETDVPVLVTPRHAPPAMSMSQLAGQVARVVAPVDLTTASARQVTVAAGIAQALGVPLLVAHVLEPAFVPTTLRSVVPGADAVRRAQVEEQLSTLVGSAAARGRTESLILSGEPSEEIVRLADTRGSGLIVMGMHSTGFFAPRIGTVTYRVLCLTNAMVLALPATPAASHRATTRPPDEQPHGEEVKEAPCSI
jgi:nucleotide-binding universal stress UspA family protein